jgi:hypothetical protein
LQAAWKHTTRELVTCFCTALIALFDLHFAEGGTNKAPVLKLAVKR